MIRKGKDLVLVALDSGLGLGFDSHELICEYAETCSHVSVCYCVFAVPGFGVNEPHILRPKASMFISAF